MSEIEDRFRALGIDITGASDDPDVKPEKPASTRESRIKDFERRTGQPYTGQAAETERPRLGRLPYPLGFGEATPDVLNAGAKTVADVLGGLFSSITHTAEMPEKAFSGTAELSDLAQLIGGPLGQKLVPPSGEAQPTRTAALMGLIPPVPLLPIVTQSALGAGRGLLSIATQAAPGADRGGLLKGLAAGWEQAKERAGTGVLEAFRPTEGALHPLFGQGYEAGDAAKYLEREPTQGMKLAEAVGLEPDAGQAADLIAELFAGVRFGPKAKAKEAPVAEPPSGKGLPGESVVSSGIIDKLATAIPEPMRGRFKRAYEDSQNISKSGADVYRHLADTLGGERPKAAANEVLRKAGFDGIRHRGGVDGQVWIAFDKDQIVHLPEHAAAHGTAPPRPTAGEMGLPPPPAAPPPPPSKPGPPPPEPGSPRDKLLRLVKEGKKVQGKTARLYAAERKKRITEASGLMENPQGEATLGNVLDAMKGPLPKEAFEPIRPQFQEGEVTDLFNQVFKSPKLDKFERIATAKALRTILDPDYRVALQKGELAKLETVFGKELADALTDKSWSKRALHEATRVLNLPREVATSGDISFPLRQGLFLARRVKHTVPAFKQMVEVFGSSMADDIAPYVDGLLGRPLRPARNMLAEVEEYVRTRPNHQLHEDFGLARTTATSHLVDLALREEGQTGLGEQIPYYGSVVKASNAAFAAYPNKIRVDVFDDIANKWMKNGLSPEEHPEKFRALAKYINMGTGRGNFGETLAQAAPLLNGFIFAPRFNYSRIEMLNPYTYIKMPKELRVEAIKDWAGMVGGGLAAMTLAKWGIDRMSPDEKKQASVSSDPTSPDFGKLRYGDTRLDIWGGQLQWIRLIAQGVMGKQTTSEGIVHTLNRNTRDPTSKTYVDVLGTFARSKEAPVVSALHDMLKGSTFTNEPVTAKTMAEKMAPMVWRDMEDALEDGDAVSGAMSLTGLVGTSSQTYTSGMPKAMVALEYAARKGEEVRGQAIRLVMSGQVTWNQVEDMHKRVTQDNTLLRLSKLPLEDLTATLETFPPKQADDYRWLVEMKTLSRDANELEQRKQAGYATGLNLIRLAKLKAQHKALADKYLLENKLDNRLRGLQVAP